MLPTVSDASGYVGASGYVLNPPTILAMRLGLVPGYALIETIGRRTEKRRHTVVGLQVDGTTGWVVAEQCRHAGYVRNIETDPNVRVWFCGRWG
jgi:deazaflavin-dependent oxidoreductase (nitroreductase family)